MKDKILTVCEIVGFIFVAIGVVRINLNAGIIIAGILTVLVSVGLGLEPRKK